MKGSSGKHAVVVIQALFAAGAIASPRTDIFFEAGYYAAAYELWAPQLIFNDLYSSEMIMAAVVSLPTGPVPAPNWSIGVASKQISNALRQELKGLRVPLPPPKLAVRVHAINRRVTQQTITLPSADGIQGRATQW